VRAYTVTVETRAVESDEPAHAPESLPAQSTAESEDAPQEGLVKGPYVAETYSVQVEKRFDLNVEKQVIVVEIP